MSFRFLYRTIPASKRICSYYRCMKPILRNLARDQNGRLYHYGCLQTAKDEKWYCSECFFTFDATEASFVEAENLRNDCNTEILRPQCPNCGNQGLKPVSKREA